MKNTNYFGRICRFLGRIHLFAAFILCIGIGFLLILNPFVDKNTLSSLYSSVDNASNNPDSITQSHSLSLIFSQNPVISWIITGIIIVFLILAIIYLAQKYNNVIRKIISNIAHHTHCSIHITELALTLVIWSILLTMLLLSFPLATILLVFPFVLNELFFIFGWISYGMPEYEV